MCDDDGEFCTLELWRKATDTCHKFSSQIQKERRELVLCCDFAKPLNLVTETGECRILIEAGTCFPGKLVEGLKPTCESLAILREAVETGPEILVPRGVGLLTEIVGTKPTEGSKDETAEGDNLAPRLKRFDAHSARLVGWDWCRCADDYQDKV